jgi:hypothetical protein
MASSHKLTEHRLAQFDVDGWELESAEDRHASSPESFWIPELIARQSLGVGQLAQLLFQIVGADGEGNPELNVERMWVEVEGREGELYFGRLRNQPASIDEGQGLDYESPVSFRPEHIMDIRNGYGPDAS